ncbi:MAG: AAA family ATPase [Clostridiaceae bacterium]|nr:AAA family ATPase [Clostridiaceae bacterium]
MIIERIRINQFGKFDKKELKLNKGLNIIYGMNESGKSTIQAFIKAILYDLDKKEEIKYLPWGAKGFGSSNEITYTLDNGQTYTVEKDFNKKRTHIYSLEPYKEITGQFPVQKGRVMFMEEQTGLNKTLFESSIFVRQMGAVIEKKNRKDTGERLLRLSQYGDEDIDYSRAIKELDKIKEAIGLGITGKNKKLVQVNQIIYDLEVQRDKALENVKAIQCLQKRLNELNDRLQAIKKEIEELLLLKQHRTHKIVQHCMDLKHKLKRLLEKKSELARQMNEYGYVAAINEQDLVDMERKVDKISLLDIRIEEVKNKIKLNIDQKEKLGKSVTDEEKGFINNQIKDLQNRCKRITAAGLILGGLCLSAGLVLGKSFKPAYMLMLLIPVIAVIMGLWTKKISNRIGQLQIKQKDTLEQESKSRERLQVLEALIYNFEKELNLLADEKESCIKSVVEKLENMGILNVRKDELPDIVFGLRQDLNRYKQCLNNMENNEREIKAAQQSLEVAEKTISSGEWNNLQPMDDACYEKIAQKYGVIDKTGIAEIEKWLEEKRQQQKEVELDISAKAKEMEIISREYRHPGDIEEQLEEALKEKKEYEQTLEAVDIAKDFLSRALAEMQKDYIPLLNRYAGSILEEVTAGRYQSMDMDTQLNLVVRHGSQGIKEAEVFSSGTLDQIYFAFRLALMRLLSGRETLPLILDEPFSQYDDERLKSTLSFLIKESQNRQVILFTCHKRELEMLESLGQHTVILL